MNNVNEDAISSGIQEFEKFKKLAAEAIDRAKMAEEEAKYFKGQKELLESQAQSDEARHRADLRRISELEAFIAHLTETFIAASERLKIGSFRRPTSVPAPKDFDDEIRRLATQSITANSAERIGRMSNQTGSQS